jgi:D-hexose-6-phosphate mutarotase
MKHENLKQLLAQAHQQLAGTEKVDDELKALLENLNQDIHQVLSSEQTHDVSVFDTLSERSLALSAKFAASILSWNPCCVNWFDAGEDRRLNQRSLLSAQTM